MFFFFFQNDFGAELRDFIVNPELKGNCVRAMHQVEEFQARFPLDGLGNLMPEDCISSRDNRADDFYNWVVRKTGNVVSNQVWTAHKLGTIGEHPRIYDTRPFGKHPFTKRPDQKKFHYAITNILYPFLESRGYEKVDIAEREFGKPLLLKLLYLYCPAEYVALDRVGAIDGIIDKFSLDYDKSVYARNRTIRTFFNEQQKQYRTDEVLVGPAIWAFLGDYLGFSNEGRELGRYLKEEQGLSDEIVERYLRYSRSLSRLLSGYGIIKGSLFKFFDSDINGGLERLIEDLTRKVTLSAERVHLFTKVIEVYSSYLKKKTCPVAKYIKRIVTSSISTIDGGEHSRLGMRDRGSQIKAKSRKSKGPSWNDRFRGARNPGDVVELLESSAEERKYFRHYTTLSAFLCITETPGDWMFRLTRGDNPNMNDQLEWRRLGDVNTWRRTFICSFSGVEDESAAMWGLYGKPSNEALRFSRDAMLEWINVLRRGHCKGPVVQFFDETDNAGAKQQLDWNDVDVYFADVLYGGSVSVGEESGDSYTFRNRSLKKNLFSDFDPKFEKAPEITGFIKSQDWAYEDETRIIIRVREDVALTLDKQPKDIQCVFIPIPKDVMTKVEYKRGPCVPDKLRSVLGDKIVQIIGPEALISDSKYKDNLKFK